MYSLNPIRVGAVAAILAGVFIAGHGIPTMFDGTPRDLNSPAHFLMMESIFGVGYVALLILFVVLLLLQTGRGTNVCGRLGRVGAYAGVFGSVCIIVKTLLIVVLGATFGTEAVKDIMVVLGALYMAGTLFSSLLAPVLLGIDALRIRVLPRWFALTLVIVPLVLLIVQLISSTLASYSPYVEGPFWIAIGYGLWSYGRSVETVRPTQHQPAVVE